MLMAHLSSHCKLIWMKVRLKSSKLLLQGGNIYLETWFQAEQFKVINFFIDYICNRRNRFSGKFSYEIDYNRTANTIGQKGIIMFKHVFMFMNIFLSSDDFEIVRGRYQFSSLPNRKKKLFFPSTSLRRGREDSDAHINTSMIVVR